MTERERAVLHLLLTADFPEAEDLRRQAANAMAIDGCGCGCPSIDFEHPEASPGLNIVVNASVRDTNDGLFLFMTGSHLGGIEYVPIEDPICSEFPEPDQIELLP